LTALEHEQAISDPIAQERCFELAGSLGDMGPTVGVQGDHGPGSEDLGVALRIKGRIYWGLC
jgi:hypothetical protein